MTRFVNPTAAQIIGSNVEELVGQGEHSVVHHSNSEGSPICRMIARLCGFQARQTLFERGRGSVA